MSRSLSEVKLLALMRMTFPGADFRRTLICY